MLHAIKVSLRQANQLSNLALYNFDIPNEKESMITIESSSHLYLSSDNGLTITNDSNDSKCNNYIMTIKYNSKSLRNNSFSISKKLSEFIPSSPLSTILSQDDDNRELSNNWIVIKATFGRQGYQLKRNDIIKCGMALIKVIAIKHMVNETKEGLTIQQDKPTEENKIEQENANDDRKKKEEECYYGSVGSSSLRKIISSFTCRICFGDITDEILINVCNCIGSVKYIHLSCLMKWIISSMKIKEGDKGVAYTYKHFECELCQEEYSRHIKIKDKVIDIYSPDIFLKYYPLKTKLSNYIGLEFIDNQSKNLNNESTVYILMFDQCKMITIGRALSNGLMIDDSSVSRTHCGISLANDGKYYIRDNDSKYGTYLHCPYDITYPLFYNQSIGLLSLRQLIYIELQPTFIGKIVFCCQRTKANDKDDNHKSIYNKYFGSITINPLLTNDDNKTNARNVDIYEIERNNNCLSEPSDRIQEKSNRSDDGEAIVLYSNKYKGDTRKKEMIQKINRVANSRNNKPNDGGDLLLIQQNSNMGTITSLNNNNNQLQGPTIQTIS